MNPIYYVGFSTATLVASLIMFQGFNTDDPAKSVSLLAGFLITFLGVHLLEISRKPALEAAHSALESGLMNPRLSIGGRMSIDGWNGAGNTPIGGSVSSSSLPGGQGHVRRSSGSQSQNRRGQTIFNALEEDDGLGLGMEGAVGLERLAEVEGEYDDEDDEIGVDERTRLRDARRANGRGSHSGSNSPAPAPGRGVH